jgi:NDP-sugar pyrophosphorylase family protein
MAEDEGGAMQEIAEKMTVAILAGGLGSRLQGVVPDRPKVLAEVGGRPFLCYLLDELGRQGVVEVLLLTGHRASQIRDALGESYQGMRLHSSREDEPLGTAGAVRLALPLVRTEQLLLLNGDSFCEVDVTALRQGHEERAAEASLVLWRAPDTGRFGRVQIGRDGRIVRFTEKGVRVGPGWINAGVYLLQRHLIGELPAGRALSLERDVLPGWVAARRVRGQRTSGRFLDIGTPESFAAAEGFFASAVRGEVALTG